MPVEHIAHRGAKRELPENTLGAFRRAFERGADAIELDVHATRDGVVVIHHDPDLGRSFGSLAGRAIAGLDWSALGALGIAEELAVPTLAQLLTIMPNGATAYVELKGDGIERLVADVVRASSARCAVHSFDHEAIRRLREIAPEIPRGILLDALPDDLDGAIAATGARDVWPNWRLIDALLVNQIHAAGARVIAWTVNGRGVAEDLVAHGVDGLCTDDVGLLEGL